ncbi:hypothetical protein [Cyanobium sp. ATX 6F1]|uniref:hypothetical protein n=1 Tax=Cyanobium sp. ATX 6F1 TaxID=2823702 RepID=UPI0020CEF6EA|nr:hypothetical protein [Cyanobium sp. ATX 6F1]MCP9915643.1 hypothetical protein [Cyanobium sp. ATX 6F1]
MLLQQEEWVVQPLGLESPLALEPVLQAQALPLFPGWEPVEWEAQPQALLLRPEREPGVRGVGVDCSPLPPTLRQDRIQEFTERNA